MPNRLASATSPYLLQHADNPVEWWEWEPAAFEEARRRDVPVLLSVGYAACHWCHVMAHESFEDAATAAYMNEHFVSIKVDREERPDVDAVYMAATTAMTGQGGWPMTCVLDHEGNPFFAGTYFPDQPRHGQPAFTQVLQALSEAWRERRDEVAGVAENIRAHLASGGSAFEGTAEVDLAAAIETLAGQFDPMAGGFGGAPKFPPSMVLEFLRLASTGLASTGLASTGSADGADRARHMLHRTATAMAGGGMYDQLGGGFARYSVDRGWVVPHFEKMLYDNAQLVGLYARLGTALGDRVARESADWMIRELGLGTPGTADGGFASALDADSDDGSGRHVEGAFYAWTPGQLTEALGVERGAWAAQVFDVTEQGTFEHGTSTLQLRHQPPAEEQRRLAEVRARLFDVREQRPRPARDDKVVAAWNGLAISGLCDAGLLLDEQRYVDAAAAAGELLLRVHRDADGRLLRVSRDGVAGRHAGVLEDYGCVAMGFLSLVQATADPRWLAAATELLDDALARFRADDGGFFDTAADAETLVTRPRDAGDNASPSGISAMIHALVTAHALTGEGRYRQAAEEALATVAPLIAQAPRFAGWSLVAATVMAHGPDEIAVVGPAGPERDALAAKARRRPGAVVVVAEGPVAGIPLLEGRTAVGGEPAAYVCRGFVCERPVVDPALL
ncbi:thioredoxin domain-containing protein [Nocardioides sp. BP30]|uniref:thioredoxin domain-containing protein n=1 Tax=Nocardioides sp. BP30 TaxID=3036374 RepID=UPI002469A86E|nr:thioredoxin domain-containing protein [Nocardioides sp. BP30]WGL53388.1 thioredoxin domain-containing protein [Nocardioides sp. BP30]